jgi:wyosine [tRNA(Phe)-imidazoG37] synthetase (radical SAM superfamily)
MTNVPLTETPLVFGPVPSRRLGRSLGVDLVPFKTCTYDCVYCQLGRTTCKTIERKEYVPTGDVLAQLKHRLGADGGGADYVTLAGSGEPTLHAGCGEIIRAAKKLTQTPVAVITNGSLLSDPAVREELSAADLVVPSLDAGDAPTFERINRPHKSIDFDKMVRGLADFRAVFPGRIWLEVFLMGGKNGTVESATRIAERIRGIRLERVQLNTAVRPSPAGFAAPVMPDLLSAMADIFGDTAEVIADYAHANEDPVISQRGNNVLDLLRRRPCTLVHISQSLGMRFSEVSKHVNSLLADKAIKTVREGKKIFYVVTAP